MDALQRTGAAWWTFLGLAMFWAFAATGRAQNPTGSQQQKVWVPGEVHVGNTRIYVHVFKTGFGHEHAVVGMVKEGVIHLGATQNAGYVVADLTSFVADPDFARKYLGFPDTKDDSTQRQVTEHMLGVDVLNILQFPTARVTINSAKQLPQPSPRGLPRYQLEGELELHGVKRKVSVVAEAEEHNGWVRLRGQDSLVQSEYGITPYSMALGTIGVADKIDLYGEAYIVKENRP